MTRKNGAGDEETAAVLATVQEELDKLSAAPPPSEWTPDAAKSGWHSDGSQPSWYNDMTPGMQIRYRASIDPNIPRIAYAVPSREQLPAVGLPPCMEGVFLPAPGNHAFLNKAGPNRCENRNAMLRSAKKLEASYLFCFDDDTYVPPEALIKLFQLSRDHDNEVVFGGYYPRKDPFRGQNGIRERGAAVVLKRVNGQYEAMPMEPDGMLQDAYIIPLGCTLVPMAVFDKLPPDPFGEWVGTLDDDYTFSTLCREAGVRLVVDTSIRCRHLDVETGIFY